uniref:Uncharacterized protein n=1 Tax=Glossina austeni TaxID=7395 RepID=A0A1A9VI14_GLOAU
MDHGLDNNTPRDVVIILKVAFLSFMGVIVDELDRFPAFRLRPLNNNLKIRMKKKNCPAENELNVVLSTILVTMCSTKTTRTISKKLRVYEYRESSFISMCENAIIFKVEKKRCTCSITNSIIDILQSVYV